LVLASARVQSYILCTRAKIIQIAAHVEQLFREHGAPLIFKRDDGSPFNNQYLDAVLERYRVRPLNSPPAYPRYNGAEENSIRDLKDHLDRRWGQDLQAPPGRVAQIETTAHELNHRVRRSLKGRTACAVFSDPTQRLRWPRRQRESIFRLRLQNFGQKLASMANVSHRSAATAWRQTLETWLRCQGLITVRQDQKPKVSTTFLKFWSHN
jgi:hypothetical protein